MSIGSIHNSSILIESDSPAVTWTKKEKEVVIDVEKEAEQEPEKEKEVATSPYLLGTVDKTQRAQLQRDLDQWDDLEATRDYTFRLLGRTTDSYLQAVQATGAAFANVQAAT
jgi:hypothetical protein